MAWHNYVLPGTLREDKHNFFFRGQTPKMPRPHETQKKIQKQQICLLCSVLVKIDQPKKDMKIVLLSI